MKSASLQLMIGIQVSLWNESCRQDDDFLSFCASPIFGVSVRLETAESMSAYTAHLLTSFLFSNFSNWYVACVEDLVIHAPRPQCCFARIDACIRCTIFESGACDKVIDLCMYDICTTITTILRHLSLHMLWTKA